MMKLLNKAFLVAVVSGLSLSAYAFDDPQTDYDSLYGIGSDSTVDDQKAIDIAAFETVTINEDEYENTVDPQTDYNSLYE